MQSTFKVDVREDSHAFLGPDLELLWARGPRVEGNTGMGSQSISSSITCREQNDVGEEKGHWSHTTFQLGGFGKSQVSEKRKDTK